MISSATRRPLTRALTLVSLTLTLMLSACSGSAGEPEPCAPEDSCESPTRSTPAASPLSSPPETSPSASPSAPPESAATDAVVSFEMPNLVGQDLQTAQNRIQELGPFLSLSRDLRGSRNQVLDSNWMVCTQTPNPGELLSGVVSELEGRISFGVVKREETCP